MAGQPNIGPTAEDAVGGGTRNAEQDNENARRDSAAIRRAVKARLAAGFAPLALAVSVVSRIAWTYLAANGTNFVDLHVYVGGGSVLGTDDRLYQYVYAGPTMVPLPFTYPPFAALVFYPLHWIPFAAIAFGWLLGVIAGLYAVVRVSQRLLGGGSRAVAMGWTAIGIWLDPVRSTLDYGQINVFLCLAGLCAVLSRRWWLSGLLVGVAAGVKLTPAITGLYFLGARRYGAAVCAACVFVLTGALAYLGFGDEVRHYFRDLVFDPSRMGSVASPFNQSLRGVIGVLTGRDAGFSAVMLIALAVTAMLALRAWRVAYHRAGSPPDRLAGILVVQLFGLLVSPISWTHHWVWIVPLLVWLTHGVRGSRRGARVLCGVWLLVTLVCSPLALKYVENSGAQPWFYHLPGLIYVATAVGTLGWIALSPGVSDRNSPLAGVSRSGRL